MEACLPSRYIFQGLPARTHPRGGADPSGPAPGPGIFFLSSPHPLSFSGGWGLRQGHGQGLRQGQGPRQGGWGGWGRGCLVGVNWEACLPSRHIFQGLPARTHPRGGADPSGPVARDSAAGGARARSVTGQPCWALGGVAVGEAVGVLTLQRPWQVSGRGRGRPIHSYHLQVGYFVHVRCSLQVCRCQDWLPNHHTGPQDVV